MVYLFRGFIKMLVIVTMFIIICVCTSSNFRDKLEQVWPSTQYTPQSMQVKFNQLSSNTVMLDSVYSMISERFVHYLGYLRSNAQ